MTKNKKMDNPKTTNKTNGYVRVVELFAGVGGFRIGLEKASKHFKVVWSNQWEPSTKSQDASEIYAKRFGFENHSNQDISTVKVESIPDHDLLVGGFPCQDYSVASTLSKASGIIGKKGVLWWEIHRIIKEKANKPKFLFLENVDRLIKSPASQRGRDFAIMLASLSDLGYIVEWRIINAADYGMPQRRRRIFILGYHKESFVYQDILAHQEPIDWVLKEGVIADAFNVSVDHNGMQMQFEIDGSLSEVTKNFNKLRFKESPFENSGIMIDRKVYTIETKPNYDGERKTLGDIILLNGAVPSSYYIDDTSLEKWRYFKGAKNEKRINKVTGFEYEYSEGSMIFPDALDRPSRTIITGEGGASPSRFKHVVETRDGRYRRLTPIELERLNMFPDNHTEGASDVKRAFFMGNALVVGIIEKIGRSLINRITNSMNDTNLPYDKSDPFSIEQYAKKLLNRSLRDVTDPDRIQKRAGKGKFGQLVEELYFKYKPNSEAQPDFPEAGLELKTSPLKRIGKGLVAKERLVFNIIDFEKEYQYVFRESSFWRKNSLLLLMFYLHEQDILDLDYIFKIIRLWRFPMEDLKIIKDDWSKIVAKIKDGKAHELSEGDTLYLGACTKGANNESLRKQPFSLIPAMQRAFSLKAKYLNFIIQKSLYEEEILTDDSSYKDILEEPHLNILEEPGVSYGKKILAELEPIVKNITDYEQDETFESLVIRKFAAFYGKTEQQLAQELGLELNEKTKNKFELIAKGILGIKKKKIEEFEKANVLMKTIRIERNGSIKESMSFRQIQFKDIVDEQWEESVWFEELNRRFCFVVFKADEANEYKLTKVLFWSIPATDMATLSGVWADTKNKIISEDFDHFVKATDDRIGHVRPKGRDSKDLMETASGSMEKKKCFWLNNKYIQKIIHESIS